MSTINFNELAWFIANSALTAFHLGIMLAIAHGVTRNLFRSAPRHIKTLVAMVAVYWIGAAVFLALISFGLFNRLWVTSVLVILFILAILAFPGASRNPLIALAGTCRCGKNQLVIFWQSLARISKLSTGLVAVLFMIRLSRGLIAPPLAWDALTYHLLKAGRWVQTGGWVVDNAPDAWQFYRWFPPLGDVYWAWAMLGTHSDAWLAVAGGLIWMSCGVATYSVARILGARQNPAWLAALAAVSVPAVLSLLTAAYVDTTALAIVTLGSGLILAAAKKRDPQLATVGVTAMALAVGIKITFLPYLVVGGLVLLWTGIVAGKRGIPPLLFSIPLIGVSLFWQIYLVVIGKTPFYPAPMSLAGFVIDRGQPEFLAHHFPEKFHLPYLWEVTRSIWTFLFETESFSPNHLNFTWTFPIVLGLGIAGLIKLLKQPDWESRLVLAGLFLSGLAIFVNFWLPSTAFYRGIWLSNMGRFFITWYALLLVLGLFSNFKYLHYTYAGIIVINLFSTWPRGWVWMDVQTTAYGFLFLAGVAAAGYMILNNKNRRIAWISAGVITIAATAGLSTARDYWRFKYYKDTDKVYDTIYIGGKRVPGEAAEWLDQKRGVNINFTANYGGIAYRWFRYIFLGSRLQNKVVYVSPTVDGSVWSQSVTRVKPIDYNLWYGGLQKSGIDYIVTIKPFAEEIDWVPKHDDSFKLILEDKPDQNWALFQVL